MHYRPTVPLFLVAILVLLGAPWVQAADDVLGVVPKGALGFAVVNRLADTDAKIQKLGQTMQVPSPSILAMAKERAGAQDGLEEKGSAVLVLMPGKTEDAEPVGLLFLPVNDYAKFVKQFKPDDASAEIVQIQIMGSPLMIAKRGDYAVLTDPNSRDTLKQALGGTPQVLEELAPLQKWLAERDAGVVITRAGVELISTKVQEQIRQIKEIFSGMGDQMGPALAMFEIYEKIFAIAGKEIRTCAVGVELDKQDSLQITSRTRFTTDGQAVKAIADVKAAKENLLGGLPAGPYVVAVGGVLSEQLVKSMMEFSAGLMKAAPQVYGLSEEQTKRLMDASTGAVKGIRRVAMVMGVGKAGDPIYSNVAAVMDVGNSKTFLADYQKSVDEANKITAGAKSAMFPKTQIKKTQVDGQEALELSMTYPTTPPPGAENIPNYEEMMKKLLGGGKLTAYLAAADEDTVVSAYSSQELLRQGVAAAKGQKPGLEANKELAKTSSMLLEGAQWTGFLSPQGTVAFINRIVPVFMPPGVGSFKLPAFPATPPVGFAAKAGDGGLETQLVVPAAVLKAVGKYAKDVERMGPGGEAEPAMKLEEKAAE